MKNKHWAKALARLDATSSPRLSEWHSKNSSSIAHRYAQSPTGQYGSLGDLGMSTATSLANQMFTHLNEFLGDPFYFNLNEIYRYFKGIEARAPAGPSEYHWAGSQIPMTNVEMTFKEDNVVGEQIGVGRVPSKEYNCFITGYTSLPKYLKFQARFHSQLYKYYMQSNPGAVGGGGTIDDVGDMDDLLKYKGDTLTAVRDVLKCMYRKFNLCGKAGTSATDCALGAIDPDGQVCGNKIDPYVRQKEGLKTTFKETWEAAVAFSGESCATDIRELLDGNTDSPAGSYFFQKFNIMYTEAVVNSYDYAYVTNDSARCQTPQWRLSSLEAFKLLIASIGLVANILDTIIKALSDLRKMFAGEDKETFCAPKMACHIYARYLITTFRNPACGAGGIFTNCLTGTGLPSYIQSKGLEVYECANSADKCKPEDEPWVRFDFGEIPVSPLLPTNRAGNPTRG